MTSAALLTADDVPTGFVEAATDEDDNPQPGCLAAVASLSDLGAETETRQTFEWERELGSVLILSAVSSYDDEATIIDAMEELRSGLEGCRTVSETDEDGFRVDLELTGDKSPTNDEADEQVNLRATGTVTTGVDVFPSAAALTFARVANHLAVVAVVEFGDALGAGGDVDDYYQTVIERLADAAR